MDVWTSRGAGNGATKCEIRNSVSLQKVQQALAFRTVRMKRNIQGVAMVQPPAIVNVALAENGDWQFLAKRFGKEALDLVGFADVPTRTASEPNE